MGICMLELASSHAYGVWDMVPVILAKPERPYHPRKKTGGGVECT